MHTSNVWFVTLCYTLIMLLCYSTTVFAATHNSQRIKPKASFQGQAAEIPEPLGKSWGWKKQQPQLPQNNFIIITRPAATAALPITPITFPTSPVPTSPVTVTSSLTTPTSAQVIVRQGNYRNRNRNRQNQRNRNRYRNRYRNRNGNGNWSRRPQRPLGNGVYYAREENDNGNENENDEKIEDMKNNNHGVNSKLDVDQLEKSLNPHISHNENKQINENNRYDYFDDIAVSAEVADATVGSQNHRRRISKPQAIETFSPAMSTTVSIEPIITTRTSKLPTYAMAAIANGNINNNNNKNDADDNNDDDDNNKRQTIWQGLTKRWRDRRKRRRNENNNSNKKQQQQLQGHNEKIENIKDEEDENEHEVIIDENGKIHIQKKRKKQNNNNKNINNDKKIKRPQQQQQIVKMENESQTAAIEAENNQQEMNAMNSLINDNNTNSRLQNIIKAFRLRTPIIHKNQY